MISKRVIVGGPPRTGTSLLRVLIDSSPMMMALSETGFFLRPFDYRKRRKERSAERLDRAMGLGVETISKIFDKHVDAIACFDELMELVMARDGMRKTGWAEKTPRNCEHYRELGSAYPDLYFVSMIRNGKDVVTSVVDGRDHYHCPVDRYCQAMEAVFAFNSPRHMIVRYEDLVADPETVLKRIFNHIDEPYDPGILVRYREKARTRDPSSMNQPRVFDSISNATVERWRQPEHAKRIAEFDASPEARRWNERAGYAD